MISFDAELIRRLLEACVALSREAGAAILKIAGEDPGVRAKEDGSPLTRADLASHALIVTCLSSLEPQLPVLSEEGAPPLEEITSAEAFWLVDPLDGTKEFVKGLSEYTVNIALIRRARPILGVVYAPALEALWYAGADASAWKQTRSETTARITPSTRATPVSAVVSRSHMSEATETFLERNHVTESVSHGSSIKICAIAEGAADVYPRFGPTNIWDTGAGAAVAIAAGCRVVDTAGVDLSYDPSGGTLREGFIVHPAGMTIAL